MIISINQVSKCSGPQPSSSWPLIISNLQTSFSTTSLLILMRHQLKWSRNELKATRQLGDLRNWKIWHEVVEGRLWFWPYHDQNIISLHTEGANTSFCGPTWKYLKSTRTDRTVQLVTTPTGRPLQGHKGSIVECNGVTLSVLMGLIPISHWPWN